jgi:hypothetical protein
MSQMRECFGTLTYHYAQSTPEFSIAQDVSEHAQSLFVSRRKTEVDNKEPI